jgi:hypothetical protein
MIVNTKALFLKMKRYQISLLKNKAMLLYLPFKIK